MKTAEQLYEICIKAAHYFNCDLSCIIDNYRMILSKDLYVSLKRFLDSDNNSCSVFYQLKHMQRLKFDDSDHADDGMVIIEPKRQEFKTNIASW